MSGLVPDSDRPALKRKADDYRDEEIEGLQEQVRKLRKRVEDLERRPVYVPYPVSPPPYTPPAPAVPWEWVPNTIPAPGLPTGWTVNVATASRIGCQ